MSTCPVQKTDDEWKATLSSTEFNVLRKAGTESPGTGEYNKFYPTTGYFACKGCGNPLYTAQAKFDSGCGWPAFDKCIKGSILSKTDSTHGMVRIEILCAKCEGHMGHVFTGEQSTSTNERHCVNSVSVKFVDADVPEGTKQHCVAQDWEEK